MKTRQIVPMDPVHPMTLKTASYCKGLSSPRLRRIEDKSFTFELGPGSNAFAALNMLHGSHELSLTPGVK